VQAYLTSLGIPPDEYTLLNGSGLSREARLRPSHLNAVLMDLFHDPLLAPEFLSTLSVGGVDGTLRRRFDEDAEVARVRGKTGSLDGVSCLSALVQAADGNVYAFTVLVNGFKRAGPVRAFHDAFGSALLAHAGAPSGEQPASK
jgi:D-alanyl-D-alanine carboxypeptidase/D-alanyl-D-alanine-endopeptidase (penicillin-binding protein 4)